MNDKNKFQEMLKDILEVAKVQGNHLNIEEVKTLFGDMELNDTQYEQIFAYLAANQIKINGYLEKNFASSISQYAEVIGAGEQDESIETEISEETQEDTVDTEENEKPKDSSKQKDSVYLAMYLEDLSGIKAVTPEEEQELFARIIKGDNLAKSRLIEGYLTNVVNIARNYINRGTLLEDLIQEGNIGLMSCMEDISTVSDTNKIKEFILDNIKNYIEAAIGMELDSSSFENRILDKIKFISEAAKDLSEDLGRDPDVFELSDKTKVSLEEIRDLLSMSADAVKVEVHHHNSKAKDVNQEER
jgi:RNA polymerase primary sigma factor